LWTFISNFKHMNEIILSPLTLATIPIIVGVVSVLKTVGVPSKWAPLISLVLGLGVAVLVETSLPIRILGGLIIGLSASGLYSGAKASFQ
jgi:hypothetical protein